MNTFSNADLPGFEVQDFRDFISTLQRDFVLPPEYQMAADFYFLRHWTAQELCDNLTPDGITIDGLTYLPLFKRDSWIKFCKARNFNQESKRFWLSFRAVRYPLGTTETGNPWALKAYVLIQEDKKGD